MCAVSQMLQWRCAPLPGLVRERLGGERGDQPAPGRDAAHGLAVGDLVVGRAERRRVAGRQLLLAPAELGVGQLDRQPLGS